MDKNFPAPELWDCRFFSAEDIPAGTLPAGDTLTLPDGTQVYGKKIVPDGSQLTALPLPDTLKSDKIIRNIFTARINSSNAVTAVLGAGSNFRMILYFNDREILNTTQYGNAALPVASTNHLMKISLLQGENHLRAEIFSPDDADIALQLTSYDEPAMKYGPYPLYPDSYSGSISIAFSTAACHPAGVEYRKSGETLWHKVYDNIGGKIRRNSAVHCIRLEDLECDVLYEYRTVLFDFAQNYAELPQDIHHFTIPSRKCCFTATADLQRLDKRSGMLKTTFEHSPDAGFFAFLGDLRWIGDFDADVMDIFAEPFRELSGGDLPLVMVRGNHEYYGHDTDRYFEYFTAPAPGAESYGMFRIGEVCFIMLDCGDDAPRRPAPSAWMLHDTKPFLKKQSKWLKNAVELPMCKTAKFRIVLCHGIPLGDPLEFMPGNLRELIDPFFAGKDPMCKIHLFLGGHIHYPFRSIPGENRCRTALPEALKGHPACGEKYHFPVIAVSGPNIKLPENLINSALRVEVVDDTLEVTSFDNCAVDYDKIVISPDGTVAEKMCADFFRYHNY